MKMLRWFLFVLVSILGVYFSGFGQDIHFTLVQGARDELSGTVYGMTQDAQGFLWLATDNGVYKYDGYQYRSYRHEPLNPNTPAADKIECIAYDRSGYIWLSSYLTGLDRLDPATGIFTHFHHNNKDPGSLASDTVPAILQDHEGAIWIGTEQGLDRFDSKTNKFIHYRNKPGDSSSLSWNVVRAIYEDHFRVRYGLEPAARFSEIIIAL